LAIDWLALTCCYRPDDCGFPRATAALEQERYEKMMHPDLHHEIMSIMKYGSLLLAIVFAGKIAAYAATHM
jgi:hypothetical protein